MHRCSDGLPSGGASCRESAPGSPLAAGLGIAAVVICVLTVFLISCAKRGVLRPPEPAAPYTGPVNAEVLESFLVFNRMKVVRTQASVLVYRGKEKVGRFKGAFLFESPSSMRLRIFDPFGSTAMDMVSVSDMVQIYIPGSNVLYEGRGDVFGVPRDARFHMSKEEGGYVLYATRTRDGVDEPVGEYYFDPVTLQNIGMAVYHDGMRFMEARFGHFWGHIPGRITLEFFNGFAMELAFEDSVFDAELGASFFTPISHMGKRVMSLDNLMSEPFR